ncbi:hypothetical protein B9Z65_2294 [Elsinoe australis]|uniref:Sld7 C-terminal domain-containing protein n=1 Tax=Elsinoe australis TaxID=40998 RepID=A0A2P7ZAB8_9PEZI|nr:hypothetical protein B9Z65_2294 [Elsinoe australis]
MKPWSGSLSDTDGQEIQDVRLSCLNSPELLAPDARLKFLSLVETRRIPFFIRCSPLLDVCTSDSNTASWFDSLLCSGSNAVIDDGNLWWQTAAVESDIGVLAKVTQKNPASRLSPMPTEVLFFATKSAKTICPPTPPDSSSSVTVQVGIMNSSEEPKILIKAVLLSSDLLNPSAPPDLTPPPSPIASDDHVKGIYIPEPSSPGPSKKRKSLSDTFDEATKRRRQSKKNLGESIAAAASVHSQFASGPPSASLARPLPPSLVETKKPLSRTSSLQISKSRSQSPAPRPGTSHAEPKAPVNATEQKNKDLISRLVLAGMRLHGLSQTKSKSGSRTEAEKQSDEEFKLVYHNTLKAVSFAFRGHISTAELKIHTVLLQEKVEIMLGLFCTDPLLEKIEGWDEGITPSGRTPFKTPTIQCEERGGFPFPASAERSVTKAVDSDSGQGLGIGLPDASEGLAPDKGKGKGKAINTITSTKRRREPGF